MKREKRRSTARVTNSCWQFSQTQSNSFQQPAVTVPTLSHCRWPHRHTHCANTHASCMPCPCTHMLAELGVTDCTVIGPKLSLLESCTVTSWVVFELFHWLLRGPVLSLDVCSLSFESCFHLARDPDSLSSVAKESLYLFARYLSAIVIKAGVLKLLTVALTGFNEKYHHLSLVSCKSKRPAQKPKSHVVWLMCLQSTLRLGHRLIVRQRNGMTLGQ